VTYVDELVGTVNAQAGVVNNLSLTATAKESLLMGFSSGKTWLQSDDAVDDPQSMIAEYVSGAIKPVGKVLMVGNQKHIIDDRDYLVLDEIKLVMEDYGASYQVSVNISLDNGISFSEFGTAVVNTQPGTSLTSPGFVELFLNNRVPIGNQVQVQIRTLTGGARWGFTEGAVKLSVMGMTKS